MKVKKSNQTDPIQQVEDHGAQTVQGSATHDTQAASAQSSAAQAQAMDYMERQADNDYQNYSADDYQGYYADSTDKVAADNTASTQDNAAYQDYSVNNTASAMDRAFYQGHPTSNYVPTAAEAREREKLIEEALGNIYCAKKITEIQQIQDGEIYYSKVSNAKQFIFMLIDLIESRLNEINDPLDTYGDPSFVLGSKTAYVDCLETIQKIWALGEQYGVPYNVEDRYPIN